MEENKFIDRVNKRTLFFAFIILVIAILLIYISCQTKWSIDDTVKLVLLNIGALLIATGLLTFFWDLWAKRVFLDEILSKVGLSKDIESAGIVSVTNFFYEKVNWENLFNNTIKLDLFFTYARTWRNTYNSRIEKIAKKKNSRIRIVLPDYKNDLVLTELSQRFNYSKEELSVYIKEAETYFKRLKSKFKDKSEIDIWLLTTVPYYSYYRFDNKKVIAFYSHRRKYSQVQVPVIICKGRGFLADYFYDEFKSIISNKTLSVKIT